MRHGGVSWAPALFVVGWIALGACMGDEVLKYWKQDVRSMFYHGFDSYMQHAFPEDEIRPVTCKPLTRDPYNPHNVGLNDVLGNISLTLIDSLSTLAVLASDPSDDRALDLFQHGVMALVEQFGDGTAGSAGAGLRGRGFDVDSKVQVFETTIRGVGGLLSAHLFAIGVLPITGYDPLTTLDHDRLFDFPGTAQYEIDWPLGWKYNGQLLRLAQDLAERLLPAFFTATGIPYPRVNLRYGIPFYSNSPLNQDAEHGQCSSTGPEVTETCSAGAGSLVLEFTTLSRLTGDSRFEKVAKRAFFKIWQYRSSVGLVGSGIDAETGTWTGPFTGIGAGIDSFYEYALKSYILLSGLGSPRLDRRTDRMDPNDLFDPTSDFEDSEASFLYVWNQSHSAIKRNLYAEVPHPHYINVHLTTGSPHIFWIDSLSAYYPGLLVLGGEIEEATATHLLYTALWTKYSALPERWSAHSGAVEGGLSWWGGRPELSESTYYLYQATQDPWYLHVGSMIVSDIKRRCWTHCGLSGLQDVQSGELNDRMESFFLGETTKYLFLLFDKQHPLNKLDSPFVFTTEGHPLVIPRSARTPERSMSPPEPIYGTCSLPPKAVPFSVSATAARSDLFHASHFARLDLTPKMNIIESPLRNSQPHLPRISLLDLHSPTNHSFYPWTLPTNLLPPNGKSAKLKSKHAFDIQFPLPQDSSMAQKAVRINEGILISSLAGLGLGLIRDELVPSSDGGLTEIFRVHRMGNVPLGRDEKIFIGRHLVSDLQDSSFTKSKDLAMVDLIIEIDEKKAADFSDDAPDFRQLLSSIMSQLPFIGNSSNDQSPFTPNKNNLRLIPAAIPVGLGAIPPPDVEGRRDLPWKRIYFGGLGCSKLPMEAARSTLIVLKRGGCSFSAKLANIPAGRKVPFVIVVSFEDEETGESLMRPLLDETQYTSSGLVRHHQIPMVMVGGGQGTYDLLRQAKAIGLRRRYQIHSNGVPVGNVIVI